MRIIIHGYYGAGNIGDEAILESIIDSVTTMYSNAQFTVISRGKYLAYRGERKIFTVNINSFVLVEEKVKQADMVILGGGGILQDYSGWEPQNEFGIKARGLNYYGQVINLAYKYNKPIYYYSIGVGPLFSSAAQKYACELLEKGQRLTVRDQDSLDFIHKNISNLEVIRTADPALNLKAISMKQARIILNREKVPINKKIVGICLRPWFFKESERERLLNSIAKVGNRLIQKENAHLILLPFSNYQGDQKIMADLGERLLFNNFTLITKDYPPKVIKGICGQLSLMIGMRLHALILTASAGVPIIGLSYDPKIDNFLRDIHFENYLFSYQEIQDKEIVHSVRHLLHLSKDEKGKFMTDVYQLKYKEKQNVKYLFS